MATITFKKGDDYAVKLSRLANSDAVTKRAIYAAADIVADEIKNNMQSLPTDKGRILKENEKFNVLTQSQKDDLMSSFGIAPLRLNDGSWETKIGFDGYGSHPSAAYPKGLPNQLLARAVENGSSVRQAHPFVRPAVSVARKRAVEAMAQVIEDETKRIM